MKKEPFYTVGIQIGTAIMECNMESPQKIKHKTAILSSNPISGYISEENEIILPKSYLHSHVYQHHTQ